MEAPSAEMKDMAVTEQGPMPVADTIPGTEYMHEKEAVDDATHDRAGHEYDSPHLPRITTDGL